MLFNVSEHLDRELELFGVFDLCDEILSGFQLMTMRKILIYMNF